MRVVVRRSRKVATASGDQQMPFFSPSPFSVFTPASNESFPPSSSPPPPPPSPRLICLRFPCPFPPPRLLFSLRAYTSLPAPPDGGGGSYVRRRPQRISQHQHPSLRLPLRLLKWAFRTRKEGRKRGRWELDHQFRRRRPSNAGVFGRWLSGKGRPAEVFLAGILAKGEGEEGGFLSGYFPLA